MKIGILLFEQIHQKKNIGSSRIRGHWLLKYWKEAELYQQGGHYDAIIFQKAYWTEFMKVYKGIKILDLCDPDWLESAPIVEVIDNCDAVTTSTEALKKEVEKFTDKPVIYIPDRMDLEYHNVQKKHIGQARRVIWFGYSHNNKVLDPTIGFLEKNKLELTVLSDLRPPYIKAIRNIKYDWDNLEFNFNEIVLEHDIVLMPKPMGTKGALKSLNKTYTAWALGMPVANTPDDLKKFLDPAERIKEAELRLKEVREKYDVKQSVEDFKKVIELVQSNNKI